MEREIWDDFRMKSQDARNLSHDKLTELRRRAVTAVQNGESPEDVARVMVVNRASVYGWLALYNLIYVLPLAAIVLVFVRTMGARRLGEREGRLLKLLSGLMMLGLGLCLVLAPQALGDPLVALALLAAALGLTGLAAWRGR